MREVLFCENYDLDTILTPVDINKLMDILHQADFSDEECHFWFRGFTKGFSIVYGGQKEVRLEAKNLKLHYVDEIDLWNKIMIEVGEKRKAGPFSEVPFKGGFIQSPLGLVKKSGVSEEDLIKLAGQCDSHKIKRVLGSVDLNEVTKHQLKMTRLIFHLSHPWRAKEEKQLLVNANTPKSSCSVKYKDTDYAVKLISCFKGKCFFGKSDFHSAFRHMGFQKEDW